MSSVVIMSEQPTKERGESFTTMTNNSQTEDEHTATPTGHQVELGDTEVSEPRTQHGASMQSKHFPCAGYNGRRPSTLRIAVFLAVVALFTVAGVTSAVILTSYKEEELEDIVQTGNSSCSVSFRNDSVAAKTVEYKLDDYVEGYFLDDDTVMEGGDCHAYYGPIVVQAECTEEKHTLPPCLTVYYDDYCGIYAGVCSNAGVCSEERGLVSLIDRNMDTGVRAECSSTGDMTLHVDDTYDVRAPVNIHEMSAVLAFDAAGVLDYHIGMPSNTEDTRYSSFTVLGEVRVVLHVNDACDEMASWDCADAGKFSEAIDDGRSWELPCEYVWAREDVGTTDPAKVLSELCGSGRRRLNWESLGIAFQI